MLSRINPTKAEFDAWYSREDPWQVSGSIGEAARVKRIQRAFGTRRFERGLDIGCGEGALTSTFTFVDSLTGADISCTALDRANKRHPHIQFLCLDIRDLDQLDPGYDFIACLEALYYLDSPGERLKALRDICRLGTRECTYLFSVVTSGPTDARNYFTLDEAKSLFSQVFMIKDIFPISLRCFPRVAKTKIKLGLISKEAQYLRCLTRSHLDFAYQTAFICARPLG